MRKFTLLSLCVLSSLFLAACGGEGGGKITKVEPRPQPTEKIPSPDATFNKDHKMTSSTTAKPPATKKTK
ncbi:MAG: hypothetical protein O2800_04220 [Planctomycetota bacterium]|nr:hypothetical protein [Planctomycetota bacterium]